MYIFGNPQSQLPHGLPVKAPSDPITIHPLYKGFGGQKPYRENWRWLTNTGFFSHESPLKRRSRTRLLWPMSGSVKSFRFTTDNKSFWDWTASRGQCHKLNEQQNSHNAAVDRHQMPDFPNVSKNGFFCPLVNFF